MSTHLRMRTSPTREDREERLARARAALGAAERSSAHHGGRIDHTAFSGGAGLGEIGESGGLGKSSAPGESGGLGGPTGLVRPLIPGRPTDDPASAEQAGEGRTAGERAAGERTAGDLAPDAHTRVALPSALAPLVPYGSLRAGSTVAVDGSCSVSLLLAMAAAATGEDGWCALAGLPDVGLQAARDAGLALDRLALAPATTVEEMPQLPQVLSALVDGVGVLVLGPRLQLAPALWRSLGDRARAHDTLVLSSSPPGRADLHLRAESESWQGLGHGTGRLRRRSLRVSAAGRGIPGSRAVDIVLPEVHGLLVEAPRTRRSEVAGVAGVTGVAGVAGDRAGAPTPLHAIRRAG